MNAILTTVLICSIYNNPNGPSVMCNPSPQCNDTTYTTGCPNVWSNAAGIEIQNVRPKCQLYLIDPETVGATCEPTEWKIR